MKSLPGHIFRMRGSRHAVASGRSLIPVRAVDKPDQIYNRSEMFKVLDLNRRQADGKDPARLTDADSTCPYPKQCWDTVRTQIASKY